MRFRSRSASQRKPRTNVGLWLRAVLLRQPELRDKLLPALNGGKPGWNNDEPAVVETACALLMDKYFGVDYDVREVSKFVSELRKALDGQPSIDLLKAEALVRFALGDTDVTIDDIDPRQRFLMRGWVVALAAGKLRLDEVATDQLIADAEKIAFERGWNPPLAD